MNKVLFCGIFFIFSCSFCNAQFITDELVDETLKDVQIQKPYENTNYNYESFEKVPIKLIISEKISTKKDGISDAQPLTFFVKQNVKYKGKTIIHKGAIVTAMVETYMTRGMNGIPAIIVVDDYNSEEFDSDKIKGTYVKKGLNFSPFVFPLKWLLTPFPGVGSLTNFILGGNASITQYDTVTIYYYPEWN